ncbi:metallophosphoesterase [Gallintestinimicrobium sp.]|uniref:metallophosphoesterase n=1 Tax=Gallintestinimicrobium sp. TaxID=2981655 RepID=UPI00399B3AA0
MMSPPQTGGTACRKAFGLYSDANFIAILGDNVDAQVDMALAEQQFSNFLSPPEMKTHPLLAVMGNHDDNMGFASSISSCPMKAVTAWQAAPGITGCALIKCCFWC